MRSSVPRNILPWVLLAAAVFVALSRARDPASVASGSTDPSSSAGALATPGAVPSGPAHDDPPLGPTELRDSRLHLAHEQCEEGAKRINVLEGNAPTDPKGIRIIGMCLRRGNVAWYKCIVGAATRAQAATCNRRLLMTDTVP
jgi:hypothetical protein